MLSVLIISIFLVPQNIFSQCPAGFYWRAPHPSPPSVCQSKLWSSHGATGEPGPWGNGYSPAGQRGCPAHHNILTSHSDHTSKLTASTNLMKSNIFASTFCLIYLQVHLDWIHIYSIYKQNNFRLELCIVWNLTVQIICHLEYVGEVSQVEDVVEAYGCWEEVLADLLVQADSCLKVQNQTSTQNKLVSNVFKVYDKCKRKEKSLFLKREMLFWSYEPVWEFQLSVRLHSWILPEGSEQTRCSRRW